MTSKWSTAAPGAQHPLRHGLGFVFSGGFAFLVDASVLKLLTAVFGVHPFLARIFALSCAHVVGWLSHRTFTFRMATPPTLAEFLRYAGLQSAVSLVVNWGVFVLVLVLWPQIEEILAMVISSGVAMVFSYFGMRYAAFRNEGVRPSGSGTREIAGRE
jgi:putative flippase GtrA